MVAANARIWVEVMQQLEKIMYPGKVMQQQFQVHMDGTQRTAAAPAAAARQQAAAGAGATAHATISLQSFDCRAQPHKCLVLWGSAA